LGSTLSVSLGECRTLVDAAAQGQAYTGLLEHVIRPSSPLRVVAFLAGIYGSPVAF
jgi:hypothetical protein